MARLSALVAATALLPACVPDVARAQPLVTARYDLSRPSARFDLPDRLREVSGLAFTPDGRLFAHGDERGHVFELDPATGTVGRRMEVGDQTVLDDFEGIAVAGERFFLASSRGLLYEFREVEDGGESAYRVTDLFGLEPRCEVEGLDYDPVDRMLLVACKTVPGQDGMVVVHLVPLDPGRARPEPIRVAGSELAARGLAGVHPSALALDPVHRTIVLVAAREGLVLEIDLQGRLRDVHHLSREGHAQAEGVAFGPDGTLYLADEDNEQDARLTAYAPSGSSGGS